MYVYWILFRKYSTTNSVRLHCGADRSQGSVQRGLGAVDWVGIRPWTIFPKIPFSLKGPPKMWRDGLLGENLVCVPLAQELE